MTLDLSFEKEGAGKIVYGMENTTRRRIATLVMLSSWSTALNYVMVAMQLHGTAAFGILIVRKQILHSR